MGTFIFDLVKGKTKFLYAIIFIFSFKQTKEQILFLAKPLKMVNKENVGLILGLQEALWQVKSQHFKIIFWI